MRVALAGIASIVGPDAVAFGVDFYRIGALVFVSGLALLSALMLRAGVMRPVAVLWLATFAASLSGERLGAGLHRGGRSAGGELSAGRRHAQGLG